jgi:hypothetical protein
MADALTGKLAQPPPPVNRAMRRAPTRGSGGGPPRDAPCDFAFEPDPGIHYHAPVVVTCRARCGFRARRA